MQGASLGQGSEKVSLIYNPLVEAGRMNRLWPVVRESLGPFKEAWIREEALLCMNIPHWGGGGVGGAGTATNPREK